MKIVTTCTTTSDDTAIIYLTVAVSSFIRNNPDIPVYVFCIDDPEPVKKAVGNFANVNVLAIERDHDKEITKIYENVVKALPNFIFTYECTLCMFYGILAVDYCMKNLDFDILFKLDTDTCTVNKIDFSGFIASGKTISGGYDCNTINWIKEKYSPKLVKRYGDEYVNTGTMFIKHINYSLYDKVVKCIKKLKYTTPCPEQDALNCIYENDKYSDKQILICVNTPEHNDALTDINCAHFCSKTGKPLYAEHDWFFENSIFWQPNNRKALSYWRAYAAVNHIKFAGDLEDDLTLPRTKTDFKPMFCTIMSGNIDLYCNLFVVTCTSYKKFNDLPITWNIIYTDEKDVDHIKERISYLEDDLVKIVYSPLPKVDVDAPRYNSVHWTSDFCSYLFIARIKWFDEHLHDGYDVICPVDIDCIFMSSIREMLTDFAFGPYAVGGQYELFATKWIEAETGVHMSKKIYDWTRYVNFGFGMLNCRLMYENNFERFMKLSKGYEDWFNTQEQAYFSLCTPTFMIKNYEDCQTLAWSRETCEKSRISKQAKLIHFTQSRCMFKKIEDITADKLLRWQDMYKYVFMIVPMIYIDEYMPYLTECKEHLTDDFIENVTYNKNIYDKFKSSHKLFVLIIKRVLKLPSYNYE